RCVRSGLGAGWVRRGTHKVPEVGGEGELDGPDTRCNAGGALPSGESIEFRSTHLLQVPDRRVAVATPAGSGKTLVPSHAWPSRAVGARFRVDPPKRDATSRRASRRAHA